jgi:hypothetical protein
MKARILGLVIAGAGCMAVLPAFASPTANGVHAQYSSLASQGDKIWESDLKYSPGGLDISHKTRHFGAPDLGRGDDHGWQSWPPSTPTPAAAPEIDQGSAATALTLLLGGLALYCARRRRV